MTIPSVLFIMVDQMSVRSSNLWDEALGVATPNLASLAARGVTYDRAYTPHPLCVPARIATWTASWSHKTGCRTNQDILPSDRDTALAIWRDAGLRTALIGKDHCFGHAPGLFDVRCEITHTGIPNGAEAIGMEWVRPPHSIARAHETRIAMPVTGGPVSYAVTDYDLRDYSTSLVAAQTVAFLEEFGDQPFAAWVSIPDPHGPYEVPRAFADQVNPARIELPPVPDDRDRPERERVLAELLRWQDEAGLRQARAAYLAMVGFIDDRIGQILDALDRLGLSETTFVLFCSDHGDHGGERGMLGKGGTFHDALTRVPLILSGPRLAQTGHRESAPVSLIDALPTVLHLQGLRPIKNSDGRLMPGATRADPRDLVFSEYGVGDPLFGLADLATSGAPGGHRGILHTLLQREREGQRAMATDGAWKAVHDQMGDLDELYDLSADPFELVNLAPDPRHAEQLNQLVAAIGHWRPKHKNDPRKIQP